MDDLEILRMMARCEDKEQIMQCVNEFNTRKAVTNGEYIRSMLTENHIADDRKKVRLIDANAMREDWMENGENEYVYDTNAVLDSIDAQPTVDAVEVVHGRWIDTDEYDEGEYRFYKYWGCSVCEYEISDRYGLYNYCPNCGAKMDGDGNG